MEKKIHCITDGGNDIVLLCDTRLNSTVQIAGMNDLKKKLLMRGYDLYHNSRTSSRGVAILIKRNSNIEVLGLSQDNIGNFMLIDIKVKDIEMVVGAIYGPNEDDMTFFDDLNTAILNARGKPLLMGGDWNLTLDISEPNINIDVLNMAAIPSRRRSQKLIEIAQNNSLRCPYRSLYPDKKEYTFIPSAQNARNRSRLDFFLCSESLINQVTKCIIPPGLSSTVFDHKEIQVVFGKLRGKKNYEVVKNCVLAGDTLEDYVFAAVTECYIQHATIGATLSMDRKEQLLNKIGTILECLKQIDDRRLEHLTNMAAGEFDASELKEQVRTLRADLPGIEFFENLSLSCTEENFFEVIVMQIKSNVLSFQDRFFKLRRAKVNYLSGQIKALKRDFDANRILILEKERALSNIIETNLREELEKNKRFDRLNNEKITPYFLKIARGGNKENTLHEIADENFENDAERRDFIVNYYENVYKRDDGLNVINENSIPEFLGETATHPEIREAILTENEKHELESGLTINELDKAMTKANMSSAPGIDGISNKFIKRFWVYFRLPLLKYSRYCYDHGRLTDTFRTAKIRLIPKKGDVSKIKNWRPISLLSCFYKIISRALTARLKKYIDKLTPLGQKGYSETRYCQEVLIEINDRIEECQKNMTKGALLSLDMSKAFDSISHEYMEAVLRFFNFGPNFIRWIKLIATNRTACIIMEDDTLSKNFILGKGNAQGDIISPLLFILAFQILLFKLEFDVQIEGIEARVEHRVPLPHQVQEEGDGQRVKKRKVFAFADDGTLLVAMKFATLHRIKQILTEFYYLSGLKCNVEKTCLMQIGTQQEIDNEIVELNFTVQKSVTILGMIIGENSAENVTGIKRKIQSQINFWSRFSLSLPGRINVAKSMLYSQINYLGCFLSISRQDIESISGLIENYVRANMNVAKRRLFQKPAEGGLGLFELNDFLIAQKCSWIKRMSKGCDWWKNKLRELICLTEEELKEQSVTYKVLGGIAASFAAFKKKFYLHNENFLMSPVVNNQIISLRRNVMTSVTFSYFGELWPEFDTQIRDLKLIDIGTRDNFVNIEVFRENTGLPISENKLIGLRGALEIAFERYSKSEAWQKNSKSLSAFLGDFRRGSKRFRNVMNFAIQDQIPHNMIKFAENTETIIGLELSRFLNMSWNVSYFGNSFRTFIFKLHNNTLGYNYMLSRFVDNVDPSCSFCILGRERDLERETPLHLFYSCPYVEPIMNRVYREITESNDDLRRSDLFGTLNGDEIDINTGAVFFTIMKLAKFYLWETKLRKKLPDYDTMRIFIKSELRTFSTISINFRHKLATANLRGIRNERWP